MNACGFHSRSTPWRTLAAAALLAAAGCQTASRFEAAPASAGEWPTDERGIMEAGDDLDIKFYYRPELNESQTIRPDGKITLQLIGDVQAAGTTPSSLEKTLKDKYRGLIERNEITVLVRRLSQRVVYVGGAVQRPQAVPMASGMTALGAIMTAGGHDPVSAAMGDVVVLRAEGARYRGYRVDLAATLDGRQARPFYLRQGDIVYVNYSRIYDLDLWIDQHINRLVPSFGLTILHTTGNNTFGMSRN